ncbi:unnamed protein product [Echinostoma caproni]|uniref:Ig-like domain-containing protein n=1 Tax=Echinostoma caproni TaxID=27848 RepID=A0A183AD05_9TREM|nr:unnamed protein product [Echinostoma caproni]
MTMTEAFPRIGNAEHAWPIPVYKVSLQEAWPDIADDEGIYVDWKTTDAEGNVRELRDTLRTIVLTPEHAGSVRAWAWQRDATILDMRAYYQFTEDQTTASSKRIYLQRSGCSADSTPERLAVVVLSTLPSAGCLILLRLSLAPTPPLPPNIHLTWAKATECEADVGADKVTVKRTESGCAVQFKVSDPSSSDQYAVFLQSEDGSEDKQLAIAAGMVNQLQGEIESTDISMKFVSVDAQPGAESSQLSALVTIHSKAIVDSSGCRPMYLVLHPTWPVTEQLEKRVEHTDTPFTFAAPRDQNLLVLDLELRIDSAGPDSPELHTRRSLTIPHPMAYQLELNVNAEKGEVTWSSLPSPFIELLEEFRVKVSSLIRACGKQVDLQTPIVHEEPDY